MSVTSDDYKNAMKDLTALFGTVGVVGFYALAMLDRLFEVVLAEHNKDNMSPELRDWILRAKEERDKWEGFTTQQLEREVRAMQEKAEKKVELDYSGQEVRGHGSPYTPTTPLKYIIQFQNGSYARQDAQEGRVYTWNQQWADKYDTQQAAQDDATCYYACEPMPRIVAVNA